MNFIKTNRRASAIVAFVLVTMLLFSQLFTVAVYADTTAADDTTPAVTEATDTEAKEAKTDKASKDEKYVAKDGLMYKLAVPFGFVVRYSYQLVPNYLFALIVFAVFMKIVLFPFGIKQQKNLVKQASLRPKEAAIRKRYQGRNDQATQQKVNQEIMNLYQKENFNPAGGCLPMLLQLFVVFILINVIYNPLRYLCDISPDVITKIGQTLADNGVESVKELAKYGDISILRVLNADNFKYVADIFASEGISSFAQLPSMSVFGADLSIEPSWSSWLVIIPLLTFVIVYFTSVLTRKLSYQAIQSDDVRRSNMIMDIAMPLMSAWFAFMFPALLGIYWMFQNILGVLQQLVLKKMFPAPVFTEEDYKKAEKEYFGQQTAKKKKKATNAKRHPNSLHHVDDDEEYIPAAKEEKPSKPAKESSFVDIAPLKEDPKSGEQDNEGEE